VNDDRRVGIEALRKDVIEQDRERLPEVSSLHLTFELERHESLARHLGCFCAMLGRKVGRKLAKVTRSHARMKADYGKRAVKMADCF
jgi:hypothetical protein